MNTPSMTTEEIDRILGQYGSALKGWQLRALFIGAQTSTNERLGPQNLLEEVFGEIGAKWKSASDVETAFQTLTTLWNTIAQEHKAGRVRLSSFAIDGSSSAYSLVACVQRRRDEIHLFARGIDAGGNDPSEFGPRGQILFEQLTEADAFLETYQEVLSNPDQKLGDPSQAAESLTIMTSDLEEVMTELLDISKNVHRHASSEHPTSTGMRLVGEAPRALPKIGRNDPCPCGSGRKWKRCCGAPGSTH